MQDYYAFCIPADTRIIDAMAKIDTNSRGIVFICDVRGAVSATLTDGDIRRHIMSGKSLDAPSIDAANKRFHYITEEEHSNARKICIEKSLAVLPVLDNSGRLVSLYFKDEIKTAKPQINTPVVIMAGGKGTRLYPYTKVLPKALVPIGDVSITEHIIDRFLEYGCNNITMILNHKKNMVKAYFADEMQDLNIKFVDEDAPLGTGGGLKLLEGSVAGTFFMTNCDILVFADYDEILQAHIKSGNIITMVCATKTVTIPYGTVEVGDNGAIVSLAEKPSFSFLTNTGFYVIEPVFLDYIAVGKFTLITESIQACIDAGERVGIYPVSDELWSDMGQLEEMEKMQKKIIEL